MAAKVATNPSNSAYVSMREAGSRSSHKSLEFPMTKQFEEKYPLLPRGTRIIK
jgi:hypothetical protein